MDPQVNELFSRYANMSDRLEAMQDQMDRMVQEQYANNLAVRDARKDMGGVVGSIHAVEGRMDALEAKVTEHLEGQDNYLQAMNNILVGMGERLNAMDAKITDGLRECLTTFEEMDRRIRDVADRPPVVNNTTVQADRPGITAFTEQDRRRMSAAVATLKRLGYTWNGGVEWKPPLGEKPNGNR